MEFNINPRDVEQWDADEVMEALAAIGMAEKNAKRNMPKPKKKGG